jgi:hypothetical protein
MMNHQNHGGPGDFVILTQTRQNGNGIANGIANGHAKTNGNGHYEKENGNSNGNGNGNGNDLEDDPEEFDDLEEQEIAAKLIQVKFR